MVSIHELGRSIVRVFDRNGHITGTGFLATENSIITCSHVIAGGEKRNKSISPAACQQVVVDFPLIKSHQQLQTHLIFNLLNEEVDFAELEPEKVVLSKIEVPSLMVDRENLLGHFVRAYGFPHGYEEGVWASGIVSGINSKGWLQIEGLKETGYRIQPGFSGGPVWDEQLEAVIGLVIAADKQDKTKAGFVLPMSTIVNNYPSYKEKLGRTNFYLRRLNASKSLENKDYKKALELCSENLEDHEDIPDLHLLAAIALAQGKPLERLSKGTVQLIEERLIKATLKGTTECTALVILGAVKFDFYVTNGLPEREPTFRQICKRLAILGFQSIDIGLLSQLNVSEGAYRNMGLNTQFL
jgi:hypothetical protein